MSNDTPAPIAEAKLDDRLRSATANLIVEGLNVTPVEVAEARRRLLATQKSAQK